MTTHRRRRFPEAVGIGAALLVAAGLYKLWSTASGAARPERVGYGPLQTPKHLDGGLWIVDDVMVAAGLSLPIRMTVVQLIDDDLLLHSPTSWTPDLGRSLDAWGRVRHLVAPTFAHWMHLADWQHAYPEAITWAAPGLRERSQVRRSGLRIDAELDGASPAPWQRELRQGSLAGIGGFHESWLFHEATRTLILCDLIQNLEPRKLPPATRAAARLAGGTRGTTALHVRAAIAPAREAARRAALAMIALAPERVIFAHGSIFESDGEARLRTALS